MPSKNSPASAAAGPLIMNDSFGSISSYCGVKVLPSRLRPNEYSIIASCGMLRISRLPKNSTL